MSKIATIEFDRIGRNHNVGPLVVEFDNDLALLDAVHDYARHQLTSREFSVEIDLDGGDVSIEYGRYGTGKLVIS
jgi:hypothetical protein